MGRSSVNVRVNSAPWGGELLVSPHQGLALNTSFSLTQLGWDDMLEDLPLSFSFAYRIQSGAQLQTLSELQPVASLQTILPAAPAGGTANVTVLGTVQDIHGAAAHVSREVGVLREVEEPCLLYTSDAADDLSV